MKFAAYYVCSASARGITCVWWDNAAFKGEGELFGLLDRRTFRFVYPQILQAIIDHAN